MDCGGGPKHSGADLVGGGGECGFKGGCFGASFTGCGFKGGVGGLLNITAVSAIAGGS